MTTLSISRVKPILPGSKASVTIRAEMNKRAVEALRTSVGLDQAAKDLQFVMVRKARDYYKGLIDEIGNVLASPAIPYSVHPANTGVSLHREVEGVSFGFSTSWRGLF